MAEIREDARGSLQADPEQEPRGLVFRLSEGAAESQPVARIAEAASRALDDTSATHLLSRVPPLPDLEGDRQPFAIREKSLPPPRTGKTVTSAFPPPATSQPPILPPGGPLRVTRRSPEGAVPLAPNLSVTFSEPMVAVSAHEDVALEQAPVTLTPAPPGQWRWIGTKTVLFEPTVRLPMATAYRVSIQAGTRSASGSTLQKAEQWTFSTPPPTLTDSHPKDSVASRTPVLFAGFDQRIDANKVLAHIRLRAGAPAARLRMATKEEIEGDERVKALVSAAEKERWLAFRPEDPLPPDAAITVSIGPGTPSAEGAVTTTSLQNWGFRTFGRLRVTDHECGWQNQCPPWSPWTIRFSNSLSARAFRKEWVRVDPPLRGLRSVVHDDRLTVIGESTGRTTYRVTLAAGIRDAFDQEMGADATVTFNVTAAQPSLSAPGGSLVVLDPESAPRFPVYTVNYRTLGVRLYAVSPTDWAPFTTALQEFWRGNKPPALPGRLVSSATIRTTARPDEVTETSVDLTPALRRGLGHVVISVEPGELAPGVSQDAGRRRDARVLAWVQATRIGLDAFSDTERLVAWATSLDDGRPLEGVEVSLEPGGAAQLTGRDGVTALRLTGTAGSVLVARRAYDIAILPENTSPWGQDEGWQRVPRADTLRWCIVDDRHLYRPGEVVRVKGWVRVLGGGSDGDLRGLGGAARKVSYRVADSRGNEIDHGTRELSAFGSFDLTVNLPATMNLGTASVSLGANSAIAEGMSHRHTFQVQEFRRPEFEVTTTASEGPHLVGSHATAAVSASYFAGGSLTGAVVTWRVTSSPGSFTPPNRSDYVFGTWIPWWEAGSLRDGGITTQPFSGVT
ncbi:MAG: Ig-like domain-containing protein, partial [Planctomycetes bacterium]|nr:Ig-like domain-containing protein [Planctomycetota bacterium]